MLQNHVAQLAILLFLYILIFKFNNEKKYNVYFIPGKMTGARNPANVETS